MRKIMEATSQPTSFADVPGILRFTREKRSAINRLTIGVRVYGAHACAPRPTFTSAFPSLE
ncbi:unnamed protein product [Hydatigera taeniaeformis]|uniref:Uncharacterized protein n=1 Tax=Hydatigena taeniaeformis TaxID=6205 RepID=A0A0R3XCG4_HYDTA|nr:unnamed protein product [Hydatigera taeniaeformis]